MQREPSLTQTQEQTHDFEEIVNHSKSVVMRWRATDDLAIDYVTQNVNQFGLDAAQLISGEVAWEVDLGVPVSWLQPSETTFPIQAISTQAALYSIEKEDFTGRSSSNVVDNAGRNERMQLFRSPFKLQDGRIVMTNHSMGNQWAVWQGNAAVGNRLRRIVIAMDGATFGAEPIAVGSNVLTPTSNGQLHVLDSATGRKLASPFIPSLQPDQKHSWIGPTLTSDRKGVVIADNTKRIYRIGLDSQLRLLFEKDFDKTLKGRLINVGQNIIAVGKDSSESIEVLSELDLQPVASLPLQGHITCPDTKFSKIQIHHLF